MPELAHTANVAESSAGWLHRVLMFGIEIDAVNMAEAVAVLGQWTRGTGPADSICRYVVTPNVDHIVMLQEHAGLRAAYASASLVLADGWPVVAASRWLRKPLPQRVAGSDLVPGLFGAADNSRPLRTYLLGAAPGVAARAVNNIHVRWPAVQVVGVDSPPLGFEHDRQQNELILSRIAAVEPDLLIVGFGAPKQELWVHAHRGRLRAKVAICAGATIDFLAGEKRRAPGWMRRCGLEWLHRLASEPRRLARRYFRDAVIFPRLVWREWVRAGQTER